jgi:Putative adhesin
MKPAGLFMLAAALASAGCSIDVSGSHNVVVREERRVAVSGEPELELTTFDGSLDVRAWDRNEVLVQIEKRAPTEAEASALEVRVTNEGNRIRVEAVQPRVERETWGMGKSVSLIVTVPKTLTLRADTRDGSVRADGIGGTLDVTTGDGSIRASNVSGRVDLSTGDGSINARGRFQAFHAASEDGSLTVEAEPGSAMESDWELSSGDGSITIYVPAALNAQIDAESADGSVRAEGMAAQTSTRDEGEDAQSLRGTLGTGGGRLIRLRSGDGSIRVIGR